MQQTFALTLSPLTGRVSLRPVSGSHIACESLLTFRNEEAAQRFLSSSKAVRVSRGTTINGTYRMDVPQEQKVSS